MSGRERVDSLDPESMKCGELPKESPLGQGKPRQRTPGQDDEKSTRGLSPYGVSTLSCLLVNTKENGKGVKAMMPRSKGGFIVQEAAILAMPLNHPYGTDIKAMLVERFESLPFDEQLAFFRLEGPPVEVQMSLNPSLLWTIFKCKAVLDQYDDDNSEGDDDDDNDDECSWHRRIYPTISRIHHNCAPNAKLHRGRKNRLMRITALQDIATGEEITVNYLQGARPEHHKFLLRLLFGLDCDCADPCRHGTIAGLAQKDMKQKMLTIASGRTLVGPVSALGVTIKDAFHYCEDSIWDHSQPGAPMNDNISYFLFRLAIEHGDRARAKKFAEVALDSWRCFEPDSGLRSAELEHCKAMPEQHRCWGYAKIIEAPTWKVDEKISPVTSLQDDFEWLWYPKSRAPEDCQISESVSDIIAFSHPEGSTQDLSFYIKSGEKDDQGHWVPRPAPDWQKRMGPPGLMLVTPMG